MMTRTVVDSLFTDNVFSRPADVYTTLIICIVGVQ